MTNMQTIADNAQMVVNGYAFTKIPLGVQSVNLETSAACVIGADDEIIETTMDDIELAIVESLYSRNKRFMEE